MPTTVRGTLPVVPMFLYVVQSIFLHFSALVFKSLITSAVKPKKKKKNYPQFCIIVRTVGFT